PLVRTNWLHQCVGSGPVFTDPTLHLSEVDRPVFVAVAAFDLVHRPNQCAAACGRQGWKAAVAALWAGRNPLSFTRNVQIVHRPSRREGEADRGGVAPR